jgi:hypothetical protein
MASAKITLKNDETGEVKTAPVGFSWTVLFFGFIPMLFRSDWKWAGIVVVIYIVTYMVVSTFAPQPEGVAYWTGIIFGFIYNKLYIKDLISKSYRAISVDKGELDDVIAKLGIDIPAESDGESQTPKQVKDKVVEETSGQETELQRIEDMYEKSLINDEERKAMREKVLGLE